MTHICVSKLTIIDSDNGLSPGRHQAIIWTNAGILLIRTLGTNFSEILSKIQIFSFKNMHVKMLPAQWRQFCLCLNALIKLMYQMPTCVRHRRYILPTGMTSIYLHKQCHSCSFVNVVWLCMCVTGHVSDKIIQEQFMLIWTFYGIIGYAMYMDHAVFATECGIAYWWDDFLYHDEIFTS